MKSSKTVLFSIIKKAKKLGSYSLANLAFAALVESVIDWESAIHFKWIASPDDDEYYDLFVISDGIREACIPTPLLRNPQAFREICSKEESRSIPVSKLDTDIVNIDTKKELEKLRSEIEQITPNAQELAHKYLAQNECQVCPFYATGHNKGAIHCSVHPFGYPDQKCPDWDVDLGLDAALLKKQETEYLIEQKRLYEIECEEERAVNERIKKKIEKESYWAKARESFWLNQIKEAPLSDRLQWLLDRWGNRKSWHQSGAWISYNGKSYPEEYVYQYDYPYIYPNRCWGRYELQFSMSSGATKLTDADDVRSIEKKMREAILHEASRIGWNRGAKEKYAFIRSMIKVCD